jgi:hypothetical protein
VSFNGPAGGLTLLGVANCMDTSQVLVDVAVTD